MLRFSILKAFLKQVQMPYKVLFLKMALMYRETSPGTGKDEFGVADQDVLFWINHAKELTFANTDRVYLLGESRGGMEVCRALRDAPAGIIKAAASVSGIYDLTAVI